MAKIALHWYLPTHGDGRTLTQAGAAVQSLYMGDNSQPAEADSETDVAPAGVRATKQPLINARGETAASGGMFKPLWHHGRAVVPANGWFEWQKRGCGRFPGLSGDKLCIPKRIAFVQSSCTLNMAKRS